MVVIATNQFTITDLFDGQKGDKGDTGSQGLQGIPGAKGADGVTYYTWIKYADTPTSGMSDLPTGKAYMGIAYNKTTATESTNYSDYSWSLIKGDKGDKGDQGIQGIQGIQGVAGKDGVTTYTWVKYATSSAGANMSDLPDGKTYIGLAYNKTTATESTNPADYAWALIKGEKGDTGLTGSAGTNGKDGITYYTWLKYADTPTTGMSDDPTGKTYMGIAYNKTTATESTNYADYSWSLIRGATGATGPKGDQGLQGIAGPKGADGQTTYTWVKYADDSVGNGMSDLPDGKRYLGLAYNKTTATESTNKADYSWSPLYDNVQVGGRNLLTDTSGTLKSDTGVNTSDIVSKSLKFVPDTFQMIRGKKVVLSFKVRTKDFAKGTPNPWAGMELSVTYEGGEQVWLNGRIESSVKATQDWTQYSTVVDIKDKAITSGYITTLIRNVKGMIEIKEWQMEVGNIVTDYNPATEDLQSGIDSALSSITDLASDSLLTALEKRTLKKEWDTIVAEKPTLEGQATTYGITTEKTNFTTAYNTLNTYITPLLSSLTTTSTADGNTLRTNFKNYYDKKALLQKKITDVAKGSINDKADTTVVTPIKNAVEGWTIGQINGKPAINGDMIQKDTILANRLAVGSFENLFTNGSGEYGVIGWDAATNWSIVNDSATAYSGSYFFKGLHTGSASSVDFYDSNFIQVRAGEKYYFEGYFKLEKTGTAFNTRTFLIKWRDKAGAVTWTTFTGNLTTTWQKLAYEVTVPATAVTMQIGLSVAGGLAAGNATYADSLFCKRMLTGELIVDGSIKAAQIDVNNLVAQTAFINAVKATDISGDRIKGGKISGVTYESINASNPKIKAVIETNSFKSYGASDGTKQNYSEMKEGGISVFEMAESGSPFGDKKAYVEPARFNAVQGSSRSTALEPTELRFWVPNMIARISYDVVPNGFTGYGLRLEAPEGILAKNTLGYQYPALQFDSEHAIYFDGYGNIKGGINAGTGSTWSVQDADNRVRLLIGIGKGSTQTTEINAYSGGIAFNHNSVRAAAIFRRGNDAFFQLGTDAAIQWNSVDWRIEFKTPDGSGWRNIAANAYANGSSLTMKTDLQNFEESVLDEIVNTDIMTYRYKSDVEEKGEEAPTHVGVISEFAPKHVATNDGKAVDLYAMISFAWKAIQELKVQNDELKAEISQLKAPEETPSETPTN